MPRVSEEHRESRREQIRQAALRAFVDKGYQHTSIADVVSEAGLSAGAIYSHYEGKHDLFAAVAEKALSQNLADVVRTSAGVPAPGPLEVLRALTVGPVRGVDVGRLLVQLWAEATVDPEIRAVVQRVAASLREILTRALTPWYESRPDLAPDGAGTAAARLAPVVLVLGQGFQLQRATLDDFDVETYLEHAAGVLPG
ncbi:TetR/AcrR family transcriptional regulator [Cellulomonas sp. PhB143]|uniref:TetR/AcrR family transcriptional regulator n=1 Tax=Cellulomonas sp. PhB143 TaxID=2485186 RepID=UPI000F465330|nr:TetR/AcrR family transcriptional regulator [Cellulomonas sp. PhB143]ROS77147.1 TetR family transcriptional regulator [Cellulomonas sp. PhB143]